MKNPVFTGAAVAIITPMYEDGSINFDELGRIIEDQIARGTDAIVICGTTGECSTMTDEEQLAAIKFTVETVNHRVPVIAGAGSNDTDHGCALAAKSAACGADALLLVTPYYNKTTQAGLVAHFTAMAEAGGIPVILYNVPSRTGLNITPETALELSRNPLINGIKEASGNISQVAKIAQLCGDELNIYSGNDDQVVPLLSLGGKGVISVVSNVKPELVHNCCKAWFEGDPKTACKLQLEILPLADALFCEVNPIPVKYAMNVLGWEAGSCRLPLVEPEETKMTDIIIQGIGGRMGHALCEMIANRSDCRVVAGIDQQDGEQNGIPVYDSLEKLDGKGDVIIDFSAPAAVEKALTYCEAHKMPIVVCTTGLSEELQLKVVQLSRIVPVFKSANMSIGINLLSELCKRASAILGADYDVEIVEQHHHNKLDAPSGTALMLADAINEENNGAYYYVYDRSSVRQKRDPKEIGISSVRGGSIVGDHEVLFCGPDEVITLKHTAYSRSVFANGAINAAVYLAKKEPGLYNMGNMIAEL